MGYSAAAIRPGGKTQIIAFSPFVLAERNLLLSMTKSVK
jgi:hypothetical protein